MGKYYYDLSIDNIDKDKWDYVLEQFADSTIYQTWQYANVFQRTPSHILVGHSGSLIAACQIMIRNVSFLKSGIAEVKWGPLLYRKDGYYDLEAMPQIIESIKNEYGIKRGFLIKFEPGIKGEHKQVFDKILLQAGFIRSIKSRPYRTFIIDLTQDLRNLRNNFLQKWRNSLNKAEKCGLKVIQGRDEDLYNIFLDLSCQMISRKKLDHNLEKYQQKFRDIQKQLPIDSKMNVLIALKGDTPVSAAVYSSMGNTAIYIFGATGQAGLQYNGSYLLQWNILSILKEEGIRYYDLGAFNPQLNPGVYTFKAGMAGKATCEEVFLGEYIGCYSFSAKILRRLLDYTRFIKELRDRYK